MIIEEHCRMEITLPDGRFFEITENDLVNDSLSVSSQCVNGNSFSFGCVSPAQLSVKFRIRGETVSRYDMYGAEIVLYRWFGSNPPPNGGKNGIFNVTSVTKTHDIFTVSASDNVCWLDSSAFDTSGTSSKMGNIVFEALGKGGSLWNAINAMGAIVHLVDGLEFDYTGLDALIIPNGAARFTGFGANDPEGGHPERLVLLLDDEQSDNLRDYAAWLAAYMGGFVCADADGQIQFRLFQTPYYVQNPTVLQYTDFQKDTLEIAGFRIFLYRNTLIAEDNFYFAAFYDKDTRAGVVNLEIVEKQNPFIEFIYSYHGRNAFQHIAGPLLSYQNQIPIRPFSGTYHGTQYLILGQYIRIMDENGKPCDTVITGIHWKFRGGQQITCAGEDARTLSEARKRSQAVRTGERLKTQLSRLEDRVTAGNSQFSSEIAGANSRISVLEGQNLNGRISVLENQNLDGRINGLSARMSALENGGG